MQTWTRGRERAASRARGPAPPAGAAHDRAALHRREPDPARRAAGLPGDEGPRPAAPRRAPARRAARSAVLVAVPLPRRRWPAGAALGRLQPQRAHDPTRSHPRHRRLGAFSAPPARSRQGRGGGRGRRRLEGGVLPRSRLAGAGGHVAGRAARNRRRRRAPGPRSFIRRGRGSSRSAGSRACAICSHRWRSSASPSTSWTIFPADSSSVPEDAASDLLPTHPLGIAARGGRDPLHPLRRRGGLAARRLELHAHRRRRAAHRLARPAHAPRGHDRPRAAPRRRRARHTAAAAARPRLGHSRRRGPARPYRRHDACARPAADARPAAARRRPGRARPRRPADGASARCAKPPPAARGRPAGAGAGGGARARAVGHRRGDSARGRPSCWRSTATASWATASTAAGSSCAAAACSAAGRSSMPPASSPTSCAAHRGNGARACARSSSISARALARAERSTPARSRQPACSRGCTPRCSNRCCSDMNGRVYLERGEPVTVLAPRGAPGPRTPTGPPPRRAPPTAGTIRSSGRAPPSRRSSGRHRGAVVARAKGEERLARLDVVRLAAPRRQRGRLERAAVRERERPRLRAARVDRVQVLARLLVGLAAGEEDDPGHRRGHGLAEAPERPLGDLLGARLLGEPLPEMTMFGLSRIPRRSTRWW